MLRSWVRAGRWWQRVPGHKSHGRKGIFVWPRCSLDALPTHPVQTHSLCMSRTFKIMSFLSKARKGKPGQVRFLWLQRKNRSVTFSRHWKRPKTKAIVAPASIIKTHYSSTFQETTRPHKAVSAFSSIDVGFQSCLSPRQALLDHINMHCVMTSPVFLRSFLGSFWLLQFVIRGWHAE